MEDTKIGTRSTQSLLAHIVQYGVSTLFILLTLICLFSPSLLVLKQVTAFTLYIMLAFLGLGLLFFVYQQQRLMMISLLCCCALSLHLKLASNKQLRLSTVTNTPSLRASHISLGNAENDYASVIRYILSTDADVLSFQELTPDWNDQLIHGLSPTFHHIQTLTRLDQYGMGFFSRFPFGRIDTLYYGEIPMLTADVSLPRHGHVTLVSCQSVPPVNQSAFRVIRSQFETVCQYIAGNSQPVIVLGDFHLPPWSSEVQKFKTAGQLQDSRRGIQPRNFDGSMSLPRIPVDHILFNNKLECTSFAELGNGQVGRLGITGSYQLHQAP